MKVTKFKRNSITGKLEEYTVEEAGDFVFSTGTNVPREKLKPKEKKNKGQISKTKQNI